MHKAQWPAAPFYKSLFSSTDYLDETSQFHTRRASIVQIWPSNRCDLNIAYTGTVRVRLNSGMNVLELSPVICKGLQGRSLKPCQSVKLWLIKLQPMVVLSAQFLVNQTLLISCDCKIN